MFTPFVYAVIATFWVFVFWTLWLISKSLKDMRDSLKEIAGGLQEKKS
jgi:hypothetical protein